jgi:hypothetical protein
MARTESSPPTDVLAELMGESNSGRNQKSS